MSGGHYGKINPFKTNYTLQLYIIPYLVLPLLVTEQPTAYNQYSHYQNVTELQVITMPLHYSPELMLNHKAYLFGFGKGRYRKMSAFLKEELANLSPPQILSILKIEEI